MGHCRALRNLGEATPLFEPKAKWKAKSESATKPPWPRNGDHYIWKALKPAIAWSRMSHYRTTPGIWFSNIFIAPFPKKYRRDVTLIIYWSYMDTYVYMCIYTKVYMYISKREKERDWSYRHSISPEVCPSVWFNMPIHCRKKETKHYHLFCCQVKPRFIFFRELFSTMFSTTTDWFVWKYEILPIWWLIIMFPTCCKGNIGHGNPARKAVPLWPL